MAPTTADGRFVVFGGTADTVDFFRRRKFEGHQRRLFDDYSRPPANIYIYTYARALETAKVAP